MLKAIKVSKLIGLVTAAFIVTAISGAKPAQAAIERQNRVLLVTANLTTFGQPRLQWLYQFLDASAVSMAQLMMLPHYRSVYVLSGANATSTKWVDNLATLAGKAENKAVDSFIHLHGAPGTLYFANGAKSSASLKSSILAKNIGNRLRLLYSTACFGASHAQDLVNAGFNAASGSRGVNANSSFEYPMIMTQLGLGNTFAQAINAGNDAGMRALHDGLARTQGFTGVDSFKIIKGNTAIRLSSSAI